MARLHVRADGRVGEVRILRGADVFHDRVREVLMGWRYEPAMRDGRAVAVSWTVRIPFSLH